MIIQFYDLFIKIGYGRIKLDDLQGMIVVRK